MKKQLLISVLVLAALSRTSAGVYFYTGAPYGIPDGNPVGVWSSVSVSGVAASPAHVSVTLDLSGGYNGDLYACLIYGNRAVPLLNRAGVSGIDPFGCNGAGMNVTFSDITAINIHAAGNGYLSGNYRPDGQDVSPTSSPASFSATGGSITLDGTFGGLDPNGVWTLFLADVVSSAGMSTLNGWSLNLTAVPEPDVSVVALASAVACAWWSHRKFSRCRE